ncbi:MAG: HTH domain-containing protein [Polyangiales bacterium]
MTFTEAAAEVLRIAGKPLHFKDITQMAIERNLLSHVGKTPDVTMGARLSLQIKKEPDGEIVRVKPGVFGLKEWEGGKGKRKKKAEAEPEAPATEPSATPEEEGEDAAADQFAALASEVDAAEEEAREQKRAPSRDTRDEQDEVEESERPPLDAEERMRSQLAATASDLFEEEEDDDQPLFGGPEPASQPGGGAGGPPSEGGGRRRRRRRRRGKGRDEAGPSLGSPSFAPIPGAEGEEEEETIGVTIGDERDEQPTRRAIVLERVPAPNQDRDRDRGERGDRERGGRDRGGRPQEFRTPGFQRPQNAGNFDLSGSPALEGEGAIDEFAGRELADVVLAILQTVDRNQGPVPFRAIAEAAQRRGRVAGDLNTATSAIAAATRGDNLRRLAAGQRPRFRFGQGGRVAPTDWVLGSELLRFEQDALLAIERYRDASRRVLSSKLQKDMSGPALVELLLLVLDRIGFKDVRPVRRAGLPGGESHFSAIHVTAGGEEIRTAIVLRRDGREIGRERVIDLRGSLHHYGPASAGWLLTTGQVLSGAREEASAPGTTPITLFDSVGFARLLEENDIAVVKTKIALAIPDVELLETLRGL